MGGLRLGRNKRKVIDGFVIRVDFVEWYGFI